jgi:hypothetical protein
MATSTQEEPTGPTYVGWTGLALGWYGDVQIHFYQTSVFGAEEAVLWNAVLEKHYGPAWTDQPHRIIPREFTRNQTLETVERLMRDSNPLRFPKFPVKPNQVPTPMLSPVQDPVFDVNGNIKEVPKH